MATPDPYAPDDIKRRGLNPGIENAWGLNLRSSPPNARAAESGVTSTAPAFVPHSADAVDAGPPAAQPVFSERGGAQAPSALDADQPLPAGVRLRSGTPGTNDVIYEGVGRFGERAFGNNQFNVDGRKRGVNPGLDALADKRSGEIARSVASQGAAAAAAAQAARIAPSNAKEYTDRIKAESDVAAQRADTRNKGVVAALDAQSKANANVANDYFTKIAEAQSPEAAAALAADAGLDPSDPTLPPLARAGATAARRQLIDTLNNTREPADFASMFGAGMATDAADIGDFDIETPGRFNPQHWFGYKVLAGPADEHGVRRRTLISQRDADRFAPLLRGRGVKRRSKVSDG